MRPFAIEAVRRTPSDKKGGHFARRKADGRLVLRETAQTAKEDLEALADLERHRFTSTNNIWIDLARAPRHPRPARRCARPAADQEHQALDPGDSSTPEVIQIETAMGAAIEVFEGATLIEVGRDRFVPVKTTNDLLVLRSDVYAIGADFVLDLVAADVPYVDLDPAHYKLVGEFDKRFPEGAPSMAKASSLKIEGDWTFGHGVEIVGEVALDAATAQRVPAGEVLSGVGWLIRGFGRGPRRADPALGWRPLAPVTVPLGDAVGLVCAADVRPWWGCRRSTTPRWTGTPSARPTSPRRRRPRPWCCRSPVSSRRVTPRNPLAPGTAWRIMTGAPVPVGADAVVPFEWTDRGRERVRVDRSATGGPAHPRWPARTSSEGDVAVRRHPVGAAASGAARRGRHRLGAPCTRRRGSP